MRSLGKTTAAISARLSACVIFAAFIIGSCEQHRTDPPSAGDVQQFKYCSGFTSAAEHSVHKGLAEAAQVAELRQNEKEAASRLKIPPAEMQLGMTRYYGNGKAVATSEVGRGLEDGLAMLDEKSIRKLLNLFTRTTSHRGNQ
jgi:hypothetical protein